MAVFPWIVYLHNQKFDYFIASNKKPPTTNEYGLFRENIVRSYVHFFNQFQF